MKMFELKQEKIEKVKEEYLKEDIYTIARHALSNQRISALSKKMEQTEFTRNHFSIDIKTLPVADQMQSGRCWIFAGCNVLREKIAKKYKLESFELSQNYVSFYDKLEKCNYFLNSMIELKDVPEGDRTRDFILQSGIEDGGQWDMFVNIVKKYGVVPKAAFPETFQSSHTTGINKLLNRYVRKFAVKIQNLETKKEMENLQKEYMHQIYKALCSAFGVPPTKFSFEYEAKEEDEKKKSKKKEEEGAENKKYHIIKEITPKEFLEKYVEIDLEEYVSIINSPTKDKPFHQTYTVKYLGNVVEGNPVKYLNLEMDRFKAIVTAQLKDNEVVWFGSDCDQGADWEDGVWDDETFDRDRLFQMNTSLTKEEMLDYRDSAMNHAMVITGVNLEKKGKKEISTKWKIENSWGDKVAHKGYYVASDSWFDKFVYQAVINKKYLTKTELKELEKKPKKLEPWDPMGTLA